MSTDDRHELVPFATRLTQHGPVLLDGATGTELTRRGVSTQLPLWSASALVEHPDVLREIHADYASAGAEVLTANTFRTHARNLRSTELDDRAAELTRLAVEIARQASEGRCYVAGSQAPLEDCYRPDLVPSDAELLREHRRMSRNLADAAVDLILVETQNTIREAVAATRAATETERPVLVSFVCGQDGRLLSGERVGDAVLAILPWKPAGLLINCCAAGDTAGPLAELHSVAPNLPFGAYANIGRADPVNGWLNTDAQDPDAYAAYASVWIGRGARLIGGCCGTTPAHVRRLQSLARPTSD